MAAPDRSEAADYYFTYIDRVPPGDIRLTLADQAGELLMLLRGVPDDRSLHRYAQGKWTMSELVSHLNDAERVFAFRAFWFARGFDTPLATFDQDAAIPQSGRTSVHGTATWTSSRPFGPRPSRSSMGCQPSRGIVAALRAATRSPFVHWRTSAPAM